MQRIQVGLIGLVVVLLFVSLANMALDRATDTATTATDVVTASPDTATNAENKDAPAEPMAELGVAPVSKDADTVKAAPTTAPQQR